MAWLRIPVIVWRLAWPYILTPWQSPLLRWRMETYSGVDAHRVTAGQFFGFLARYRTATARFLYWAASL